MNGESEKAELRAIACRTMQQTNTVSVKHSALHNTARIEVPAKLLLCGVALMNTQTVFGKRRCPTAMLLPVAAACAMSSAAAASHNLTWLTMYAAR
jgi:hypothetical protein